MSLVSPLSSPNEIIAPIRLRKIRSANSKSLHDNFYPYHFSNSNLSRTEVDVISRASKNTIFEDNISEICLQHDDNNKEKMTSKIENSFRTSASLNMELSPNQTPISPTHNNINFDGSIASSSILPTLNNSKVDIREVIIHWVLHECFHFVIFIVHLLAVNDSKTDICEAIVHCSMQGCFTFVIDRIYLSKLITVNDSQTDIREALVHYEIQQHLNKMIKLDDKWCRS